MGPRGFEPRTSAVSGRRPNQARRRAPIASSTFTRAGVIGVTWALLTTRQSLIQKGLWIVGDTRLLRAAAGGRRAPQTGGLRKLRPPRGSRAPQGARVKPAAPAQKRHGPPQCRGSGEARPGNRGAATRGGSGGMR